MTQFDFVRGEDFRASLESDYAELQSCLQAGAWKAVHVLSGSIIEAVLVDYLISSEYQGLSTDKLLRMDLGDAISACENQHVLTEKTSRLATVIRLYRNLIHPGRATRLQDRVDEKSAKVAVALTDMVVEEISGRSREIYGYTAEQIASKIERDTSSTAIIAHLLKECKHVETERLLLKILPQRYATLVLVEGEDEDSAVLASLRTCFRLSFEFLKEESKTKIACAFVRMPKEDGQLEIEVYETAFLKTWYLAYLSPDDASMVKSHIISVIGDRLSEDYLKTLEGIGSYLTCEDVESFFWPFLQEIAKRNQRVGTRVIIDFLYSEYLCCSEVVKSASQEYLDSIISRNEPLGHASFVQSVRSLKSYMSDDLPF